MQRHDRMHTLATAADAGLIADLSRRTFHDAFAAHNTPENMHKFMTEQFTREGLMEEVLASPSMFILAEIMREPAGYARLRSSAPASGPAAASQALTGLPSIEIARIYALQSMLGKGVGHALMARCIAVAGELGRKVVWLGVWEHNQRAIEFYRRWGFEKFGEHDFLLGDDLQKDWLMRKAL